MNRTALLFLFAVLPAGIMIAPAPGGPADESVFVRGLPAGQHEYMFVVDGERWVPDPLAGRYVDDGFGEGQQNSLLIVRPAAAQP